MTVPIATSPGRSGFGPQLSLSYDSGAGQRPVRLRLEPVAGLDHAQDRQGPAAVSRRGRVRRLHPLRRRRPGAGLSAGRRRTGSRRRSSGPTSSGCDAPAAGRHEDDSTATASPLPPAHRGPVRAHRALDARSARPAMSTGARSPRTTSSPLYGKDANSRIADPLDAEPHLQLADLRDARRQGQRHRLRLQAPRTAPASTSDRQRCTSATAATPTIPPHAPTATSSGSATATARRCSTPRPAPPVPGDLPIRRRSPTPTGCSRSSSTTASTTHDAADGQTDAALWTLTAPIRSPPTAPASRCAPTGCAGAC